MFKLSIKEYLHTANNKPITSGIHPFHAKKDSNGKLEGLQHWYLTFTLEMRGCSETNNVLTNEYTTVRRYLNQYCETTNTHRSYFFCCETYEAFHFDEVILGELETEENNDFFKFEKYNRPFDGRGIPKA